jgi:KaiC/GvpD/RAD55 family RecA-like ATPase
MKRISTGVKGLDEMLLGGLIPKRPYVITGPPGAGKTTMGIHFLMEGIKADENVILVALDEPPNEVKSNAQAFGFDLDFINILDAIPDIRGYKRGGLIKDVGTILDFHTMRDVRDIRMSRSLRAMDVSIHSVQKMLRQEAEDLYEATGETFSRVVIDSMTSLKMFGMKGEDQRILLQSFIRFVAEMEATTIIITQVPEPENLNTEVFLARGEIRLHKLKEDNRINRGISIEKFRGSDFDEYIRPVRITPKGIEVQNGKPFNEKN